MSKHTPGPWRYEADNDGDNFRLYAGGEQIVGCYGYCGSPWVSNMDDARLIAAAPELLEALKAFVYNIVPNDPKDALWVKARAAIAKAEGSHE